MKNHEEKIYKDIKNIYVRNLERRDVHAIVDPNFWKFRGKISWE